MVLKTHEEMLLLKWYDFNLALGNLLNTTTEYFLSTHVPVRELKKLAREEKLYNTTTILTEGSALKPFVWFRWF